MLSDSVVTTQSDILTAHLKNAGLGDMLPSLILPSNYDIQILDSKK